MVAEAPERDETTLFMLRELEKLQLLVGLLRDKGLITNNDLAVVELQAEVRANTRIARIMRETGKLAEASDYDRANAILNKKIEALKSDKPTVS